MAQKHTHVCLICGYEYNPEDHDNLKVEDLGSDYSCPDCHVGADMLDPVEGSSEYTDEQELDLDDEDDGDEDYDDDEDEEDDN